MPDTSTGQRSIVSSSGWWLWIALLIGLAIIITIIISVWRFFSRATQTVREETSVVTAPAEQESKFRIVRTDTEIILIDDPIIPEGEVAVEDIQDNPANFLGQDVTVSGSVADFSSPTFFSVKQAEGIIGVFVMPDVIKVNELEGAFNPETAMVRVSGKVKNLTREREKREFGFSLQDLDEAFWTDRIVIEAVTITVITEDTT